MYNNSYENAIAYYWQKIQSVPDPGVELHRLYQDACQASGATAWRKARRYYKGALERSPDSPEALYLYGRCLPCNRGMAYFNQAREIENDFYWAYMGIGACEFEKHRYQEAAQAFEKAIEYNPDAIASYQNLSLTYLRRGQRQHSRDVFRRLIKRKRQNAKAYECLGNYFLSLSDYQLALAAYRKAAGLGADNLSFRFNFGFTSFKQGNPAETIRNYKRSIQLGNHKFDVYYNLAAVYEMQARYDLALEYFEEAYQKSGSVSILYSIGNCAVQTGLYSKAIASYKDFLKTDPEHLEALFGLANAYHIKKEFKTAGKLYLKILQLDDNFVKAYYNLGSIYAYHEKDIKKMNYYWSELIRRFPDYPDRTYIKEELKKINGIMDWGQNAE